MNGLYLTVARWVVFASVALGVYLSGDSKYGLFVIYSIVIILFLLRILDRFKKITVKNKKIIVAILANAAIAAALTAAFLIVK